MTHERQRKFLCGKVLRKHARQDSNLQPSVPKTDALSSCATGACSLSPSFFSTYDRHMTGVVAEVCNSHTATLCNKQKD